MQLHGNQVKIRGRHGTRAIQIVDAEHVLERLESAERTSASIRTRYAKSASKLTRSSAPPQTQCIVRSGGNEAMLAPRSPGSA